MKQQPESPEGLPRKLKMETNNDLREFFLLVAGYVLESSAAEIYGRIRYAKANLHLSRSRADEILREVMHRTK